MSLFRQTGEPGQRDMLKGVNDSLVAGSVSGALTRLCTCPLDVLKIRFQLQLEPIKQLSHSSKYRGVLDAVRTILKEEGVTALWKGLLIGQFMYMVYGGIQFYTFDACNAMLRGQFPSQDTRVTAFGVGAVAGGVASVACHPLDVIRTRFVGQGEPKIYPTIPKGVVMMYEENGVRCFYKGLVPSLLYIAPQAGLYFGFYHGLMQLWQHTSTLHHSVRSFLCGALAGISSKTVVLPFDLVKKRLAVQGFEVARREFGRVALYSGVIDCFRRILREEGVLAFYKGTAPSIVKALSRSSFLHTIFRCNSNKVKIGSSLTAVENGTRTTHYAGKQFYTLSYTVSTIII